MEAPPGLVIRPELFNDFANITRLNDLAFGQPAEGQLVEALRRNPLFIKGLSLVALLENQLVGYILLFPVLIRDQARVFRTLALAPMSVLPGYQGKGIGSALVYAGLEEARVGKFQSVIVLGHRDYYPKFGFKPASLYGIYPPMSVPDNVFFALELLPGALDGVKGMVEYPPEFTKV
jgi:putative acetyltransferase